MDADFAIELESDDDAYSVTPDAGTVPAAGTLELTFVLGVSSRIPEAELLQREGTLSVQGMQLNE